jgi:hypothetical protein
MTAKTSSVDFGVISDDKSFLTDYELMQTMHKVEEKQIEIEKRREKEEVEKDPDATLKAYRYAHFFCTRSKTVIPKKHEAEIISHKSLCPYCQETIQNKAQELKFIQDGNCRMRYILHSIEGSKTEIENIRRKIQREKFQKLENWKLVVSMSEQKILELENHIYKEEQIEKDKLLRDENEIIAASAKELYDKYLSLTPQQRNRCQY